MVSIRIFFIFLFSQWFLVLVDVTQRRPEEFEENFQQIFKECVELETAVVGLPNLMENYNE